MSRVNILLFAFPAVVLLLLPLLCWLVGYWFQEHDFSLYLLCVGAQRKHPCFRADAGGFAALKR